MRSWSLSRQLLNEEGCNQKIWHEVKAQVLQFLGQVWSTDHFNAAIGQFWGKLQFWVQKICFNPFIWLLILQTKILFSFWKDYSHTKEIVILILAAFFSHLPKSTLYWKVLPLVETLRFFFFASPPPFLKFMLKIASFTGKGRGAGWGKQTGPPTNKHPPPRSDYLNKLDTQLRK